MSFDFHRRYLFAVLLIPAASIYSIISTLLTTPSIKSFDFHTDEISIYEHRFDGVKQLLGHNTTVGYLFDRGIPNDEQLPQSFYLTQFVLAPVVVVPSTMPSFIVGNFTDTTAERAAEKRFIVVKDFGNGVVLLRHK